MKVKSNMQAFNANRQFGIVSFSVAKSTEKLSSGYKINRAADDAAGLAISEKMRRQIRGLTQASNNAQDGVAFCQIADGALDEVHSMLKRCKELSIQSANGTNCAEDRSYIQSEVNAIMGEIDRVHRTAEFNEMKVFRDDGIDSSTHKENAVDSPFKIEVEWNLVDASGNSVPVSEVKATGRTNENNNSSMGDFVIKAATDAVSKLTTMYPNLFGAASSSTIKIGLNIANIDGVGNTLASAALKMSSTSTSTVMSYSMNIDTSDYSVAGFDSMSDAAKADLAATIAHEMTHLVMYDTLTDNMLSGRTTSFPKWLVEGMAQTSSGDGGWVSYRLSPGASDAEYKSYMSQLRSMPYGAGYLATLALGQAASGSSTVSSANIAKGLDELFTPLSKREKSLDELIAEKTGYANLADFELKFTSGDADTLKLVKDIMNARGASGAGSLFGDLSDSQSSVFEPAKLTGTASNYIVDKGTTWMSNAFGAGYEFPPEGSLDSNGPGFILQVGTESGQIIRVEQFNISAFSIFGGAGVDVSTQELALNSLDIIDVADAKISNVRSYYGAMQNRLEHTINNLNNVVENTTAAESLIRDTDMSLEMVAFSNNNIIKQAAIAVLTQANQSNQGVLSLLS